MTHLTAASHLLSHREEFKNWATHSRTARWHKKTAAQRWGKTVLTTALLALTGWGASVMWASMHDMHEMTNITMLMLGAVTCNVSFIAFVNTIANGLFCITEVFNPILNSESKKYGVKFNVSAQKSWGAYTQEQKMALLEQVQKLDEQWSDISAHIVCLINTTDLPYVWWGQMEQIVQQQIELQAARDEQSQKDANFIELQSHIQQTSAVVLAKKTNVLNGMKL